MLTPDMIDKMNKATGNNVPLDGSTPVQSRADQIRAIGQAATKAQQPPAPTAPESPTNGLTGKIMSATQPISKSIAGGIINFGKNVLADENSRANDVGSAIGTAIQKGGKGGSIGDAALQTAGAVGGGLTDIFKEGANSLIPQPIKDLVAHVTTDRVKDIVAQISKLTPDAQKKAISEMAAQNPELIKDFGAVGNILGAFAIPSALEGAGTALSGAKDLAEGGIAKAGSVLDKSYLGDAKTAARTADAAQQDALDVIRPKLTAKAEAAAKAEGRGTTKGILKTTTIQPSANEIEMAGYAKEAGLSTKNTFDQNINLAKEAQKTSATKLRAGLEKSDAIWNKNDLKGVLSDVPKPLTIKSEPALDRLANNFQKAILNIAQESDKKTVGILDLRQSVDKLIDKEFPASIYTKDTPVGQYVRNVRQTLNDFAASKLPEGKLPDGSTFKGELRRQSMLYDAIDNISANAPKVGDSNLGIIRKATDLAKKHPYATGALATGASLLGAKGALDTAAKLIP